MGIKVEHQGNATSRIVGANVGGNAKAREERASAAAQRSAYAFAAGNRQLGGAHASGAQTGHTQAQLGHASASLIAPPKYTPLEDSHLVTKDRVDDRQEWDRDRQAWVRRYDSGEKEQMRLDRVRADRENYDLSTQGLKDMSALNNDIASSVMSGRFSEEEANALMKEADAAKRRILYADMFREKQPTAEETFAKNTFTNADGVVFTRDGTKMIYDPSQNEQRRQEAEDKRYQDAVLKLGQGYTTTEMQDDGMGGVTPVKVYKQYTGNERDAILKRLFPDRFAKVPSQASVGAGTEGPVSSDATVNKWVSQLNGLSATGNASPAPAAVTPAPAAVAPAPAAVAPAPAAVTPSVTPAVTPDVTPAPAPAAVAPADPGPTDRPVTIRRGNVTVRTVNPRFVNEDVVAANLEKERLQEAERMKESDAFYTRMNSGSRKTTSMRRHN